MGVSNDAVQMMLLGDAVEHADLGVIVWNAERRYIAVNPKAAELVGTTREALLEQPVGSTNRSAEAVDAIEAVLRNVPARGEITTNGRDVEWVVFPTRLAGLEHVVGVFWEKAAF